MTSTLLVLSIAVAGCATPGASEPATSSAAPTAGAATSASSPGASPGPSPEAPASNAPPSAAGSAVSGEPVWLPEWAGDDLPAAVADRRPLPFCGLERAPAPQPMEFVDRAVRLCFWEAAQAGAEAEFVSIQTTMEGAPFAQIYRLAADGTVEVLTDFTQDPLGSGGWERMLCNELVEGEGDSLLGVNGCEESTPLE